MRAMQPQAPSMLRDIFEGVVDTGLGMLGAGPDTTANRTGAVLGAAFPFSKFKGLTMPGRKMLENSTPISNVMKGPSISQIPDAPPVVQMGPNASEVERLIAQMQGKMKSIPPRGVYKNDPKFLTGSRKPGKIYDETGSYLAEEPRVDPAYEAHKASSVGKTTKPKLQPSNDVVDRMLKKRR